MRRRRVRRGAGRGAVRRGAGRDAKRVAGMRRQWPCRHSRAEAEADDATWPPAVKTLKPTRTARDVARRPIQGTRHMRHRL
eukprot:634060-Prymnesium_polylepis.1